MRNQLIHPRALLTVFAAVLVMTPLDVAFAQDPEIRELVINVLDPTTKETLAEVAPDETLTLAVGAKVRLRMVAVPAGQNRGLRYPSTRFELVSGRARVDVTAANEETGNITLLAIRPDQPNRPHERTVVTFQILENWPMPAALRKGSITIEVEDPAQQVAPPPPLRRGVVLYDQPGFQGYSETFVQSDPQLADNPIRDNAAGSIRVAPGCEAVLFDASGYNGRRVRITQDVDDLSYTELGNRAVSSIQISCGLEGGDGHGYRRGVTLFADEDFRGRQEKFYADDYNLEDNPIRNDSASSVRVDPGCRVTLYGDASFRGRAATLDRDARALSYTEVGNDKVSSLRVECDDRR